MRGPRSVDPVTLPYSMRLEDSRRNHPRTGRKRRFWLLCCVRQRTAEASIICLTAGQNTRCQAQGIADLVLRSRISKSLRWRLVRGSFGRLVREAVTHHPYVHGDSRRVSIGQGSVVNDALMNCASGDIRIGPHVFFGHGVTLLAGAHDYSRFGVDRQNAWFKSGRDILICEGVWVATNATIIGPCRVGEHAVVAAGAVVVRDVEPYTVVAGVPAKKVSHIEH